jgi:hypothetical protein
MKTSLYLTAFIAFAITTLEAAGGFRGRPSGTGTMGPKNSTRPGGGKPGGGKPGKNITKLVNCTDGGNHTQSRNRTGDHH